MSGNARVAPASVAVVGGGPVALAAAIGFAQAMPGARVTLVPAPVVPAAFADRLPLALPSMFAMLARIGCPADALLARGVAHARIATRFLDWNARGTPFLVGDDAAPVVPGIPLHQLWLRADTDLPFPALGPDGDAALHLDPHRITQVLASIARQHGVVTTAAGFAAMERGSDRIDALRLQDGTRQVADVYIDATGPARRLALAADTHDWHAALPCHHLLLAPATTAPDAVDRYRATAIGWIAHWPGVTGTAFDSEAPAEAIVVAPGRLAQPWHGNVIALGEAAAQPGALGLTGFTLALGHLALALELLPARGDEPLLRAEYNRRAGLRADRLRDFLAAHYWAGSGRPGTFRARLTRDRRPSALDAVLTQFERRGHLPHADEESVVRDAWFALLLGAGIRPERAHPVALGIPRDRAAAVVADLAARSLPHLKDVRR